LPLRGVRNRQLAWDWFHPGPIPNYI